MKLTALMVVAVSLTAQIVMPPIPRQLAVFHCSKLLKSTGAIIPVVATVTTGGITATVAIDGLEPYTYTADEQTSGGYSIYRGETGNLLYNTHIKEHGVILIGNHQVYLMECTTK